MDWPKKDGLYVDFSEYMGPLEVLDFLQFIIMPNVPAKHRPQDERTIINAMQTFVLPHEGDFTIHQNSVAPGFDPICDVATFNEMGACAGVSGKLYEYRVKTGKRHAFKVLNKWYSFTGSCF
jgi:hypothetical protein